MTDLQIMTICISSVLPISMLLYSNSPSSDLKTSLDSRISDLKTSVDSRIIDTKESLRAEMALGFQRLENKIDHLAGEVASFKDMFSLHLREHHGIK